MMLSALVSSLCLLVPVATVVVGGETTCPTSARVAEKLRSMSQASDSSSQSPGRVAELSRNNVGLVVTLRSAQHVVLAERQFEAHASCEDLAAAAAVVIASWEGELGSENVPGIETLANPPALPAAPSATRSVSWDLGAAITLNRVPSSTAPGAWVHGSVGLPESPLRLAMALFAQTNHERALGQGVATWRRTGLAIGPRLQSQQRRLWAAAEMLVYAGYLQMEGQGQPQNASDAAWDAGFLSALRVGWRWRNASPWLSLGGAYSPIKRVVVVEPASVGRLPAVQLSVMAGFSWHFGNSSSH